MSFTVARAAGPNFTVGIAANWRPPEIVTDLGNGLLSLFPALITDLGNGLLRVDGATITDLGNGLLAVAK